MQRRLGSVAERVVRKNKELITSRPLTISANHGLVDQTIYFNKQIASKDLSNYYLIKKGEFAYNKSYSSGYPYGTIKKLELYDFGALSTLYIVFNISKENNQLYFSSFFDSTKWHKEIQMIAVEGARNHGLLNISVVDFFNIMFYMPHDVREQIKIGILFKKIDNLIALYQRKIEELNLLKKEYLKGLFPQKDSKIPKYRFKGFTDDWELRELKDVADYRNGKAHEQDIDEGGRYIVVNSKFVSSNGEVKKFSNTLIEPLKKNELAFVLSDVPNGKAIARTFLVDKDNKYSLNQRIAGITPHKYTDSYFLSILMNRNAYFLKFDNGVGQTNLSKADVEMFQEYYPTYEEQALIGTFFSHLDHLITFHQRKLDSLIKIKKYYLNNMFI